MVTGEGSRKGFSPAAAAGEARGDGWGKGSIAAARRRVLALGHGVGDIYTWDEEGTRCPIAPLVQRGRDARPLDGLSGGLGLTP